jgi:endonuclease G
LAFQNMSSKAEEIAEYLFRVAEAKNIDKLLAPAQRGGEEAPEPPGGGEKRKMAEAGMERIKRGEVPTPEQISGIEAIILPKIRPVLDVVDGDFRTDHPLWLKLNGEPGKPETDVRKKLKAALPSIGRIELPGHPRYPYGGTGFLVGKNLLMTNRHVAAIFANGVGTRSLSFKTGHRAGIDFLRELDHPPGRVFEVKRVAMVHPYWDMALLVVEGLPSNVEPLKLSLRDIGAGAMIEVAAIGYPAFDSRNDRDEQNDLFRKVFGVKRLQPGTLGGRRNTESFGKLVPAVRHNCSTLGGNSGSALLDIENGEVIGLHFGGRSHDINYGVPTSELGRDQRVVDAGVGFSDPPPGGEPSWVNWWKDADESIVSSDLPSRTDARQTGQATSRSTVDLQGLARPAANEAVEIVVPLRITIRLGSGTEKSQTTVRVDSGVESGTGEEGLVIPWHDEDYESRSGYNENFLDLAVPMPRPKDPSVVAKARDGSPVLPYENFSIVMHGQRRMALITASNVTAEKRLKKPEEGRVYSRKGLSGLGENDQERWFPDPRLADEYQLPDVFYTNDRGAFDKGHLVRRDDVAWGSTYKLIRRANGDTYHVTNCSPQVAEFNQSTRGEDNWGDLENHVLKSAASERYCLFAGPVLDPADEVFVGSIGDRVRIRVKIPARFWKVIVAKTATGLASYGFVLEQDLSDVPLDQEFVVPEEFARFMEPLADLQERAGIVFPDVVLESDQFGADEALEFAFRAGIQRRSIAEGIRP